MPWLHQRSHPKWQLDRSSGSTEWRETDLARDGDALGEREEDDGPTEQQAERQLPAHSAHLVETA